MRYRGVDLVGEGMGIGGPVGLSGNVPIFSLWKEDVALPFGLHRIFRMNGLPVKRFFGLRCDVPYERVRKLLAPSYIKSRGFRPLYVMLMWARTLLGFKNSFEEMEPMGEVHVIYTFGDHGIDVDVDVMLSEEADMFIANELSGRYFNYIISEGTPTKRIPPWMEASGDSAVLFSSYLGIGLRVCRAEGCRLFGGREVVGKRLDWTGFSQFVEAGTAHVNYKVEMIGVS